MSRFYFHLRTPAGLERDDTGLDLDGVETAYLDAYAAIPAITTELLREKADPYQHAFEITDAVGNLLIDVPFSEVLDRGRKPRSSEWAELRQQTRAEMERAQHLIVDLREEQAAAWAKLGQAKRLLAEAQEIIEHSGNDRFPPSG